MTCKSCPSHGEIDCSKAVRIPNRKDNKTSNRLKCMGVIGPFRAKTVEAKELEVGKNE